MRLPFYQVDSFTGTLYRGNPAGVVLVKHWLPDRTMQAIATENNLSETAFVHPRENAFELRWFTPEVEVDLCGHATLASAFIVFRKGLSHGDSVQFSTKTDVLTVRREGALLSMDFPARPGVREPMNARVSEALGAEPKELLRSRDLMAVFESERDVAAIEPRLDLVAQLDSAGVIVTAPGSNVDFVSRFFAPRLGVPEDPVTGSSHCTLIPYWSARLKKDRLLARQLSKRGGEIHCEHRGDRVVIGGEATLYLEGEVEVAAT